eukprot:2359103-Amphidinium_carterae.1
MPAHRRKKPRATPRRGDCDAVRRSWECVAGNSAKRPSTSMSLQNLLASDLAVLNDTALHQEVVQVNVVRYACEHQTRCTCTTTKVDC